MILFKKIVLASILITSQLMFSQLEDLERAKNFNKCELTYTDGHKVDGYIAYFLENISGDYEDLYASSFEKFLNLDDNSFEFKENVSDLPKTITQKNLSMITVFYDKNYHKSYRLMNIRKLDNDGKLIISSKKAWLPIIKEDIISLYQKNFYEDTFKYSRKSKDYILKKRKKLITLTYLSNQKQDIAFEIYDLEKFRISMPNYNDKYIAKVLQYIFQDCNDFVETIIKNNKWDYSQFDKSPIDYDVLIDEAKKSTLDEFEKYYTIDTLYLKKESEPFLNLIESYKKNCN